MSNAANPDETLAWLQGFLAAFEWFNHKTNHGYTFSINLISKSATLRQAIEGHFAEDLIKLEVGPIADWATTTRDVLRRWLLAFQDPDIGQHLSDAHTNFALTHESSREQLLDEFIGRFAGVVHPIKVWKVEVRTARFYECAWDDIAFEEDDRVILLHLGVSD